MSDPIYSTFADQLQAETNKIMNEETKLTFNQLLRALEAGMVEVDIKREITAEINQKTLTLKGRLGAMILTGEIKLVRDTNMKDYLDAKDK
jgi:hypothetical protein